MPLIYPRSVWNPQYQDGDVTLSVYALEVFAHHSVTTQLPATATMEMECAEMRKIEATGQARFGTGISYNVVVFPSGRAYQGVSWNRRGTHTGGRNSTARSICFAGNYEEFKPTPEQLTTAQKIYHTGKGQWWSFNAPLRGHRDVSQTACPGENVYTKLPLLRTPPITEDIEMASIEDIADAVWDEEIPVPPNLVERFGERITMRRAMWATLSRAEAVLDKLEETP